MSIDFYRKYRNVHEHIITEIGQTEHDNIYPKSPDKIEELRLSVRQVDSEKVRLKKEQKEEEDKRRQLEYAEREKERDERRLEREERKVSN